MLASGGFDGQDWAKELYAPGTVGWHTFSSPSNTGDGIELAKQTGAMTLLKGGLSQDVYKRQVQARSLDAVPSQTIRKAQEHGEGGFPRRCRIAHHVLQRSRCV